VLRVADNADDRDRPLRLRRREPLADRILARKGLLVTRRDNRSASAIFWRGSNVQTFKGSKVQRFKVRS
jgi:hypothetical protein